MVTSINQAQVKQEATFDALARQFAQPPKEFSPVPIWWWSGDRLERGRLRWQMEQLIAGGIYNVIILNLAPTGPLYGSDPDQPPFLSDDWWDIFSAVCEDAATLGMRLWFYDQIGFSGANLQGELIRQQPDFAGQSLAAVALEGEGALELACPSEGQPLAAAYTRLDEQGQALGPPVNLPLDGRFARVEMPGTKRLRLMYAIQRNFDYLNPAACQRLLDTVHHAFEQKVGHFFGRVIVGSFQDELPTLPTWGVHFAAEFQRLKGYDLREQLSALWEGEDTASEQVRLDYHATRAELAEQAFFRPFFDWHERHGLICGFDQQGPARAGEPIGGVNLYADYMRTHRWYGAPGSDHHGHAKIHSSLAHLYQRPRVWIEAFHSSGWGGSLEETFDWLLPWLLAGATLYDPHAVYYSTRAGWWEWAPPSTCWRQPYWRHYPIFAQAVSRLCFLLSQGSHVCDIGVLYPTTTIQAGLTLERSSPPSQAANDHLDAYQDILAGRNVGGVRAAQTANSIFEALTGRMMFMEMKPGVLDRDRRDYDILDDDSLQNASLEAGALRIGPERYPVIILPGCAVLAAATAEQLLRFVAQGGTLVAIGLLPHHLAGGSPDRLEAFRNLFAAGQAMLLERPEDLPGALSHLPRRVEAPVPVLQRRIDGHDVLFIPAAFPHASRSEDPTTSWLKTHYSFDPDRYLRNMRLGVRGFRGVPQLWDPLTGTRQTLPTRLNGELSEIELPFDSGPAALIVWMDEVAETAAETARATEMVFEFPAWWDCRLEQTLDNRFGDFTKPDHPDAPPLQTWQFLHRIEQAGQDGLREQWFAAPAPDQPWPEVTATFGQYGWWLGPQPEANLPSPLADLPSDDEPLAAGWQPAIYSLQRGIFKDPLHEPTLGPKGHVPEEFLSFGRVSTGDGIQFRTTIWLPESKTLHLALGAPAQKSAWLNGRSLGPEAPGYLWLTPIQLKAGLNLLEWRLLAETDGDLRAYWALVSDPAAFARAERMAATDAPKKDSRLQFSLDFEVSFAPTEFTLQVSADAPCRVSLNGVEVGRQGGFDPYTSLARVQPYRIDTCRQGSNLLTLEVQDIGLAVAVRADGLILGRAGERFSLISGTPWQVRRDDGEARPVRLFRPQWLDPAWSDLWRRPHPLPGAMWIEDVPPDETVLPVVPDAAAGQSRFEWFCWKLPPGATKLYLPIAGQPRVWLDGQELAVTGQAVTLPAASAGQLSSVEGVAGRLVCMRVAPERGGTGGGIFNGPVSYNTAAGQIKLGPWAEQGLAAYSGGVRYRTTFSLTELPEALLELDLGQVRGTAEVWLNGQSVGARVWSPYRFNITGLAHAGQNTIEILILNTLAPYLQAVSPTHYIRPGQTLSGLLGPVRILARSGGS